MSYARLYHTILDNDKIQNLSAAAWWLYSMAIVQSCHRETDGKLSRRTVKGLAHEDWLAESDELVNAGLFERDGTGFQIHDFVKHQTPASEIERKRDEARDRMRRLRGAKKVAQDDDEECSQDVRANKPRTFARTKTNAVRSVRSTDTDTDTDTDTKTDLDPSLSVACNVSREPEPDAFARETMTLAQVSHEGFARFGQMSGTSVGRIGRHCPLERWEWEAAINTRGKTWAYVATVIERNREESAKSTAPPVDRYQAMLAESPMAQATQVAMEIARAADAARAAEEGDLQ